MQIWNWIAARFGAGRDMLGFSPTATPTADAWLATFTRDFVAHPTVEHGARALMSGLRFYSPAFVAALAALPPAATRLPALAGHASQAIYTAAGPIIVAVYEQLIRRSAGRAEIQRAFLDAAPGLLGRYDGAVYLTSGAQLRYSGRGQ